jgi:phosphoribosylanthranilate isomerase
MIRVKVCGITTREDAELAARLGAAAIGMILWPSSPRAVGVARARDIARALPAFLVRVGVFVNQPPEDVTAMAAEIGLDAIQLHGDEDPLPYTTEWRGRIIKAVAVKDGSAEAFAGAVPSTATVLLDAHDPVKRGGTGLPVDWTVAAAVARKRPVILSGGLTPDNVSTAIAAVAPYAVDVSSGVESSPGRKDPAKLRAFFAAVQGL